MRLVGPLRLNETAVERARIITAVAKGPAQGFARLHVGEAIGHFVERDQIAPADREPVEPKLARRHVDEPLHEEAAFETPRSPIGTGWCLVADHGVRIKMQVGYPVGAGREL